MPPSGCSDSFIYINKMSLTLGEKLRQAREERGISISEVAEQTRISPHYLDSIENDDYRTLPGGIFNKGFVKSYAKYVGIDEQEALQDYSRLIATQEGVSSDEPKTYKPEVLTDDRASSSMIPTIVFAVIILGLMTWGLLTLVNYIQNQQNQPVANSNTNTNTANTNSAPANTNTSTPVTSVNEIKIEVKTSGEPVPLYYWLDGSGASINKTVTAGEPLVLNPKQSVKFSYYKSFGGLVQLTVNGKPITAPSAPIPPKKNAIEFEINKDNVVQLLNSGQIATGEAPTTAANTNTAGRTAPR
jgi:cytoskeleton protein RodZ